MLTLVTRRLTAALQSPGKKGRHVAWKLDLHNQEKNKTPDDRPSTSPLPPPPTHPTSPLQCLYKGTGRSEQQWLKPGAYTCRLRLSTKQQNSQWHPHSCHRCLGTAGKSVIMVSWDRTGTQSKQGASTVVHPKQQSNRTGQHQHSPLTQRSQILGSTSTEYSCMYTRCYSQTRYMSHQQNLGTKKDCPCQMPWLQKALNNVTRLSQPCHSPTWWSLTGFKAFYKTMLRQNLGILHYNGQLEKPMHKYWHSPNPTASHTTSWSIQTAQPQGIGLVGGSQKSRMEGLYVETVVPTVTTSSLTTDCDGGRWSYTRKTVVGLLKSHTDCTW